MKTYGARLSLHTALQGPQQIKYQPANNPDELKIGTSGKRKKKQQSIAQALMSQKGSL